MDPLSVTASIITVLGAAQSIARAISKLNILIDTPDELFALLNEVSDIQMVFSSAKDLIETGKDGITPIHIESLTALSRRADSKLLEIESLIRCRFDPLHRLDGAAEVKVPRWRWLKERGRVLRLQQDLRSLRSTFAAILTTVAATETSSAKFRLEEIRFRDLRNQRRYENDYEEISNILKGHDHLLKNITERLALMPSPKNDIILKSIPFSDKAFAPESDTFLRNGNSSGLYIRGSYLNAFSCQTPCGCACHSSRYIKTPQALRDVLGSLFIGYTSIPMLLHRCNKPTCQRSLKGKVALSYFFPSWLCSWRIIARLSFSGVDGPELLLRVPHVIPTESEIFACTITGDIAGLQRLFREGLASPYDTDHAGHTALHLATWLGMIESCRFLMKAGSDLQAEDVANITPMDIAWNLILSKRTSKAQALQELFADNADMDYLNSRQFSEIHRAVLGLGSGTVDQLLVQHIQAIDINARDSTGLTSLAWAAAMNDANIVRILLEQGADPNIADRRTSTSPLMRTADAACLKLLIDAGADVNARQNLGLSALFLTMENTSCTRMLLDHGADPNLVARATGQTPVRFCIQTNHSDSLIELLHRGADYSRLAYNGSNIVHTAFKYANATTLDVLTKARLRDIDLDMPNSQGETAFSLAEIRKRRCPELCEVIDNLLMSLSPEFVPVEEDMKSAAGCEATGFEH